VSAAVDTQSTRFATTATPAGCAATAGRPSAHFGEATKEEQCEWRRLADEGEVQAEGILRASG
jgi:hypothetical protein